MYIVGPGWSETWLQSGAAAAVWRQLTASGLSGADSVSEADSTHKAPRRGSDRSGDHGKSATPAPLISGQSAAVRSEAGVRPEAGVRGSDRRSRSHHRHRTTSMMESLD